MFLEIKQKTQKFIYCLDIWIILVLMLNMVVLFIIVKYFYNLLK